MVWKRFNRTWNKLGGVFTSQVYQEKILAGSGSHDPWSTMEHMHPAFQLPNRVSRLYPILALIFLLSTASFLFLWEQTRIELSRLPSYEAANQRLEAQVTQLTNNRQLDATKIKVQEQNIADNENKLADLQKQLKASTDDISAKEQQIKNQQAQLDKNAADLEDLRSHPPLFSFQNSSSLANVSQKEDDVKELVTKAYPYIQDIYGTPYLLNSITIAFVNSLDIDGSAGEIVIKNSAKGIDVTIHLQDFDKTSFQDTNTVIHEMIHGFHGAAVFQTSALEEGITVAAADAVMAKMMADGKMARFPYLYIGISDAQYSAYNESLQVHANPQAFYSDPNVAKVYQLIGKAWYALYQSDPTFFKRLNAYYYPEVQQGNQPDTALVLNAIRATLPTVKGQSIATYLANNHAFNPR